MVFMAGSRAQQPQVAYFSMEIGLDPAMPTYSGGLGILAGDTLRTAADLGVPMVGVSLLHRNGYFHQHLDARGNQTEEADPWYPKEFMEAMPARVMLIIEGREVHLQAWRYIVLGISGNTVPVYFLDTNLPENSPWDQKITDNLYGGDDRYRICQEAVLGLGGVSLLMSLGYVNIQTYHMNEGHSALLTLALLYERAEERSLTSVELADREAVRQRCVFTTHTPVPAGHDKFSRALVEQVLGGEYSQTLEAAGCYLEETLNITYLALNFSRYINGVSLRHEEVSRDMFPQYPINSITNGVHAVTWTALPFRRLYDCHIPEWRRDNAYLRYAVSIPLDEIQLVHGQAKEELFREVEQRTGVSLDPSVITLGFARRATSYKRADLLFSDLERLKRIAREVGPMQVIYAGKAHPKDQGGKAIIRRVFQAADALGDEVRVVYLEGYDMSLAKLICSGVDLWLNTPQRPREASGTSGMKAALNGIPSLSVLDGWWVEGHVEGVTGWSIGKDATPDSSPAQEIASLYKNLEEVILPMFYHQPQAYASVMRYAIAINGSFFHSQRMVRQYMKNAYQI
jgi:glycogen phosphorylase